MATSLYNHRQQRRFIQDGYAEALRFGQFAPRFFARQQVTRFGTNRAGDFAAVRFYQSFGFVAAVAGQGSGDDEGESSEGLGLVGIFVRGG
jgi:hypothetical protein